jgi:uncharacterized Zn-finger protein
MSENKTFNHPETVYVSTHKVSCNGNGGALGHPLTYYVIGEAGYVECTYCDKRFVLQSEHH